MKILRSALFAALFLPFSTPGFAQGTSCSNPDPIVGFGTFAFDTSGGATTNFGLGTLCLPTQTLLNEGYFVWRAPGDGDIRFEVDMPGDDEHLAVYRGADCGSACIARADRRIHAGSPVAYLDVFGVDAGDLFLVQLGSYTQGGGPGTLDINWQPCDPDNVSDDPFEPNSNCATSALVGPGIYYDVPVTRWEGDYYRIRIPALRDLHLQVNPTFGGVNIGVSPLGCPPGAFASGPWSIRNMTSQPLDYYLTVFGSTPGRCSTYDLIVDFTVPDCVPAWGTDDTLEENDTCETATLLTPGFYSNLLLTVDDPDYFAFDVPAGDRLEVEAFMPNGNAIPVAIFADCAELQVGSSGWTNWGDQTRRVVTRLMGNDFVLGGPCVEYDLRARIAQDPCLASGLDVVGASTLERVLLDGFYPNLLATDSNRYLLCVAAGETVTATFDLIEPGGFLSAGFFCTLFSFINCPAPFPGGLLVSNSGRQFQLQWTNQGSGEVAVYLDVVFEGATVYCNRFNLTVSGTGNCDQTLNASLFCQQSGFNSAGLRTQLMAIEAQHPQTLLLHCAQGPPGEVGFVLGGTGSVANGIILGQGELCLDRSSPNLIGRYNLAGSPFNSFGLFDPLGRFVPFNNSGGAFPYAFEVPDMTPWGTAILAGETLHFQLWHRDVGGTSNLSNGVSVTF